MFVIKWPLRWRVVVWDGRAEALAKAFVFHLTFWHWGGYFATTMTSIFSFILIRLSAIGSLVLIGTNSNQWNVIAERDWFGTTTLYLHVYKDF